MNPRSNPRDIFPDYREISDPEALPAKPVVSVFTATYMHAAYLADCIEGVAAQITDFPIELIVAEDSSPDDTRAVAMALQKKYPHLVRLVFTCENKGAGPNTVLALSLCRGEFIGYCEGDDFWIDPHKLQRQIDALRRFDTVDMSFTRGFRLYEDGERLLEWNYGEEERIVRAPELLRGFGWMVPTASMLFRAEILLDLPGWFERAPFGDALIVIAGSVRGGAHYDPHPTICYRVAHSASFTVELESAGRRDRIAFLKEAIAYLCLACQVYDFPRRYIDHRLDDYRLSIAGLQFAEGQPFAALLSLAGINPGFLLKGLWRRIGGRRGG